MVYNNPNLRLVRTLQSSTDDQFVRGRWDWRPLGVVVGLAGGISAATLGSLLTAISWFVDNGSHVKSVGTALLALTIPLLFLGAHCLDLRTVSSRLTES